LERGRAPGGRLAAPELHGRPVDLGASYLTATDPIFAGQVADWQRRGLVEPWTRIFDVHSEKGFSQTSEGQMRYRTPGGLRSLARDLLAGVPVDYEHEVDAAEFTALNADPAAGPLALAMPDPQARRLLDPDGPLGSLRAELDVDYDPVIAIAAGWAEREWSFADGIFVNHHPVLSFLADDGARRGDGAPVLVAHSTAAFAADHVSELADVDRAGQPVLAAVRALLELPNAPLWMQVHRWRQAKPAEAHRQAYAFSQQGPAAGAVGAAGDSWCPSGSPRVESAWLSGTALGQRIVAELSR
jgi:renalase